MASGNREMKLKLSWTNAFSKVTKFQNNRSATQAVGEEYFSATSLNLHVDLLLNTGQDLSTAAVLA